MLKKILEYLHQEIWHEDREGEEVKSEGPPNHRGPRDIAL